VAPGRRQREVDLDGRSPGRWYRRNRGLLQHALGRRGESRAVHTPQHRAARRGDLNRRQGDRRGEGVGDQKVVFDVVAAIITAHHTRLIQWRDKHRGGDDGKAVRLA
jgi:hypothetical protein